ncbi:hypothetical protein JCM19000A_31150 [Silvimonas sp. JCM 19000]
MARIEQEWELAGQHSHAHELLAGTDERQREIAPALAQFRREQLGILDQSQQLGQNTQHEAKAPNVRRACRSTRLLMAPFNNGTCIPLAAWSKPRNH